MRTILWCLLFVNFSGVMAHDLMWHQGSMVTNEGSVLVGDISVDAYYDIVLIKQKDNTIVDVFPSHKISSVHFYDVKSNLNRKFISLSSIESTKHAELYEVVLAGEMYVLRKPKHSNLKNLCDKHDFEYVVKVDDELLPLKKFAEKILPSMRENPSVNEFIVEKKLDVYAMSDAIRIIGYYNKLSRNGMVLSMK